MELKYQTLIEQALNMEGAIGTTYSRFYNYSFVNQMFFMAQGITEPVANFKTWASMGRYPAKGTGKFVIMPVPLYEEKDGKKEQSGLFFRLKRGVFAYSDTHGEEIEIPPVTAIDWTIERAEIVLDIKKIPYSKPDGNTQGYSHGRQYAINPMAVYPLKTTMHELAHIVLGHTANMDDYAHNPGTAEFQAEATAYILMNEFESTDWNKSESRAYIQGWLKDDKPSDKDIKAVFTAVNKIIKAGMPKEEK